jgi:pilus assembly protein CpaE
MSHGTINAIVAVDGSVDAEAIRAILPLEPDLRLVGVVDGLRAGWSAADRTPSDLLVVACSAESPDVESFIRESVEHRPGRPVVVIYDGSPNGFVPRIFGAGADDIVMLPAGFATGVGTDAPVAMRSVLQQSLVDQVQFALEKTIARRRSAATAHDAANGRLVVVLGPKGGVGKTLTTASLSVSLAEAGKRVAVVDLDLQFGDVGLALGLSPGKTIYDLVQSGGSLDAQKVQDYLVRHASGVEVLLAPVRPDQAGVVTPEFLAELYEILRGSHDVVVVDTPPGFTPEVIVSIDSSTDLCMVGMLDALSLKNTKLGLETLDLMGYDAGRVRILLNRADSRVGITRDDVHTILGRPVDVLVPSNRDIPRAVNEGSPIVLAQRGSDAAKAFRGLAAMYLNSATETETGRRRWGRKAR